MENKQSNTKIKKEIQTVSKVLKNLYIPIEKENFEIQNLMVKYNQQLQYSLQQVVGSQSIEIPPEFSPNQKLPIERRLAELFRQNIHQWSDNIKTVVDQELRKKPDEKISLSIIEYWRQRATTLNMLHQELCKPETQMILDQLNTCEDKEFLEMCQPIIQRFEEQKKELTKYNGEAKDNVKFLNTLERQFKNLQSNDLNIIEKTIPQLLNGLKLVYIISRHFKSDERIVDLLITISNEICNKVEKVLCKEKIFYYPEDLNEEEYLDEIEKLIIQGKNILQKWKTKFEKTKEKLEEEGGDRWDFDQKPIKDRPEHMIKVLDKLKDIVDELKIFMLLLGPKLKAVTGNIDNIDVLLVSVKKLNHIFLDVNFNIYDRQNWQLLKNKFEEYKQSTKDISEKTNKLIESTFNYLRSSVSAFELLQKFKEFKFVDQINEQLQKRYTNVIRTYQKELSENRQIFEKEKDNKYFSKKKPPVAGAICWKRAIYQRIKIPIIRFIKKQEQWNPGELNGAKEYYKKFAKQLEAFENEQLNNWLKNVNEKAISYLKKSILTCVKKNSYQVNFSEDFQLLINEAKHLDKMGYVLPKTILNIALQEKEYYKSIDRVKKMLFEYNQTYDDLSDIEKNLFQKQLKDLDDSLNPVINSFNLNSLGINDFINSYREKLKNFNELKNKVDEKKRMIEDIILKIEQTQLISENQIVQIIENQEKNDFFQLTNFYSSFDTNIQKIVNKLIEKYKKIGETMLTQIEYVIYKKNTGQCSNMKYYYHYWETRIYNAIVKMLIRGLLTFKTMINRPGQQPYTLFKVSTEFHYMKVITIPHQNEIRVTINNLIKNIKETAGSFIRWKTGTCQCYDIEKDQISPEELINYSFLSDINENQTIKLISVELSELKKQSYSRLDKYKSIWEEDKNNHDMYSNFKNIIWNQKNKFKIDKILEKNPTTENFEFFLDYFYGFLQDFKQQESEINAGFIRVDFHNVKEAYIQQCLDVLQRICDQFQKYVVKQIDQIFQKILTYDNLLEREAETLEELKDYLNVISEIKNSSMDIEFEIKEVEEKYGIFIKYELKYNQEHFDKMKSLNDLWDKLLAKTQLMDESLKEKKLTFANQTKVSVEELKIEIQKLHNNYFTKGPSCSVINLTEGFSLLSKYKNQIEKINKNKQELVMSQKLFNLDISSFPLLQEIEEDIKLIRPVYDFYYELQNQIEEWSKLLWLKLDYQVLENGKKQFQQKLKKLECKNQFLLKILRESFDNIFSLNPLIEKLKANPNFKETHWMRLMNDIGVKIISIDLKSLTLQQVFDLNLQNHQEIVDEITTIASQESNNESQIKGIEKFWKETNFEISDFKKGNEKKGFLIKVDENIFLALNDHLITLQNMDGNKYAIFLRGTIKEWVNNLNLIQETLEIWIEVQRKWMYLEGIYIGNEDISTQLRKDAKNFISYHMTFKKINDQVSKNVNIFANCILIDSNLQQLKQLAINFDKSQKALSHYLNSKKLSFPRFYFISDEDLLSILGSSNIQSVSQHLLKLYDNCKNFILINEKNIKGMISAEGESFDFLQPIKIDKAVEQWMDEVDQMSQDTIKKLSKEGIYYYGKTERKKWLQSHLGMIVILGSQIWWTWRVEDVFRKVKEGDKYAMKKESQKQSEQLNELIEMVREPLEEKDPSGKLRKKINTLIIIEVHQRDIVDRFVRDSILDAKEFDWESQLRFYWNPKINNIQIKQCTGIFSYGYEYQGLSSRLVITPLTDRCVMTLTTALSFHLGGAPAGPAGTGKTETCKDLAKSLARRCVVTNCGENFDSQAMGNNFSGLCTSGFWGCFDEFNRIRLDVLSVVSAQIKSIQNALIQKKKTVNILNQDINIQNTIGIFVTMNPGYEGRSELPDNLKALFRPVVMVVPDKKIICENMLMSEGFIEARKLAKKMTVLYKLSCEQLSVQHHYDFGLRALKSVLVMAGELKRGSPQVAEDKVLMRALRDMNMPKFVGDDVGLFMGLINDLFPDLQIEPVTHKQLRAQIIKNFQSENYEIIESQIVKIIQLYETMNSRHTTMVIGPTGSSKTTIIEGLKKAKESNGIKTNIFMLNPKAQNFIELYGVMELQTREWTDGVLSHIFKQANDEQKDDQRWILFDGDVDAVWVENMNSVMDDSKILTLQNGDRIRLIDNCKLLFEVYNLEFASPATISRCGMVYVDEKTISHTDFFKKWSKKYEEVILDTEEKLNEYFIEIFETIAQPLLDLIFEGKLPNSELTKPFDQIIHRTQLNLVQQLTNYLEFSLPQDCSQLDSSKIQYFFVFSIAWSLGALLSEEDKERFNKVLTDLCTIEVSSVYTQFYDLNQWSPVGWESLLTEKYIIPKDQVFNKILVPTTDTVKYIYILNTFLSNDSPIILTGEQGTAKTVVIKNYLNKMNMDQNIFLNMNFSFQTNSLEVQNNIEAQYDKRRPGLFAPKGNKKLVIFIDEMHMPQKDKYNTQEPIELLKFLIDKGYMYERGGNLEKRSFINFKICGALLPPGSGYNSLNPRFLSLFNTVLISSPSEQNIEKIYNTIFLNQLKEFQPEIKELAMKITYSTIQLYHSLISKLPRTPLKFHYIFNLRDLSKVFEGMSYANIKYFSQPESFIKFWKHECTRVFSDKLISQNDQQIVEELIKESVDLIGKNYTEKVMEKPLIICNFMNAEPLDPSINDPQLYKEISNYKVLHDKLVDLLDQYNSENAGREMNLIMFQDAMQHLVRLKRILNLPKGHAMLVGYGGSGKKSIVKLSTFISQYEFFQISLKRNYKLVNFKEDLQYLLKDVLLEQKEGQFKQVVFLLTDSEIVDEIFLEQINTILTVGLVNNLFDDANKNEIRNLLRVQCKADGKGESPEDIWEYYGDLILKNLHVVLCFSPAGTQLRVRCRNFPGLVSSTNIDWFFPWPEDALKSVANHYVENFNINMEEQEKFSVIDHFVRVHMRIPEISNDFRKKTGRNNYSTPKNYLDFLENFKKIYDENYLQNQDNVQRFSKGLDKLAEGAEKISELKKVIDIEKQKVEEEQIEVKELLEVITEKSIIVAQKQKSAQEKSKSLEIENQQIIDNKQKADEILAEKLPKLKEAREKVSQIQKGELDYVRSLNNPPKLIQMTVSCLQILRVNANANENDGFTGAKAMLSDMGLINQLIEFSTDEKKIQKVTKKQITKVEEKLKMIYKELDETNKNMNDVSSACNKLLCWVDAVQILYQTNQIIKPLKEEVEKLTKIKVQKEQELQETNEILKQLSDDLIELNKKKDIKQKDLDILTEKVENMKNKLDKATNLINDLNSEKIRWGQEKERLINNKQFIIGETLLCSSFLSYFGPFDEQFRNLLTQEFKNDIQQRKIKLPNEFHVEQNLTSEVEISVWNSQGLPNDELSIQNGILTNRASRYPLCIDPQLQAYYWIIKKSEKNLNRVSFNDDDDFGRTLEMCIKFSTPMLIENIGEELDPLIDPILEKNFIIKAGRKYLKIGNEEIEFNESDFQLFMISKLSNPHFSPEIMGKTSVINYSVTFEGLKNQLLSEVVIYEQEEKEKQRKQLIVEMSENQTKRKNCEDLLLTNLVNSTGSLLENDELINTLKQTKSQSKFIELSIEQGTKTRKELEIARQDYLDVAIRGAVLFFCIQKLSAISEMYQYSLSSYLDVFRLSLQEAKPENILLHRIVSIIDKLTQNMYDYVLLGIFEIHKLMFSFQLTISIQEQKGNINKKELDFFLKGDTSIGQNKIVQEINWMSSQGYKDLLFLTKLDKKWQNLKEDIISNEEEWFQWFSLISPENQTLPKPYQELTKFEILLVLRILRPDRVINGIKKYIIEQYRDNEYYVQSPTINFKKIYKQSNEKNPILFILSPGADPFHDVQELANNEGFQGNKFKSISLGQNMEKEAEELILNFAQRGYWAMLQNCDLLPDWLQSLEKLLENLQKTVRVSPNFRLWLTTKPTQEFPLGILQNALKIVIEPPEGLKLNMRAIASKLTDEELESSKNITFKPLVYVITYFHSILLDRRKFGKIGFNVCYDFNEADFRISFSLLKLYLNKSLENNDDSIPWESLRYLIGEAMYGGRVTDDYDRRVLITYLEEYMGDFLFDKNNEFLFAKTEDYSYNLPEFANIEILISKINEISFIDKPQIFGLNSNSEITYYHNSAKEIWKNLLSMQLISETNVSALENGSLIKQISNDILQIIPEEFELVKIKQTFPENLNPMQIVLMQELERFNFLLIEMKNSLNNLIKAINGEIALNQSLEQLAISLVNGFLPQNWRKLIPLTQKNLSNWIVHFKKRVDQYNLWIEEKNLKATWLSGLHIPESFLTALVQDTCRKRKWALDKSTLYTDMTKISNIQEIENPLEYGCYVYGLYMEGASWNKEQGCLENQKPKELLCELPIMRINPVEVNKLKIRDTIKVPVYITQNRRNAQGVGCVFEADFKTQVHPSHWILQGIGVVLNTDN